MIVAESAVEFGRDFSRVAELVEFIAHGLRVILDSVRRSSLE
jgi:hypothetical protein